MGASSTPLSGNVVVEIIWDKVEDIEVRCDELEEKFGKADLRKIQTRAHCGQAN